MLLSFKKRFKDPILNLTKVFTMRNKRKVPPKLGETLYMYSGLRTNNCELISNKEKLISIQQVYINIFRKSNGEIVIAIYINGSRYLTNEEIAQFVKYDGFIDETDFAEYWINSTYKTKKAPIECTVGGKLDLFHWTDLRY